MTTKTATTRMFDPELVRAAIPESFRKLAPAVPDARTR